MKEIHLISFVVVLIIGGCSSDIEEVIKDNRVSPGDVKLNYYSNKSVTSLEIPPDLTQPSYQNSFRLSEYVENIDSNTVNLTNKDIDNEKNTKVFSIPSEILVKKQGTRRWFEIDKSPDTIWNLSKEFFKEKGFVIKKSNKKIGIMETDYLENRPVIPGSSMGWFRSFISSTIDNVNYTLPTVDSYKLRIEPIDDARKSEVHLSIRSMSEAVSESNAKFETTYWQYKDRDIALENEMLYELMIFLGGDTAKAREQIINAKEEGRISVSVEDSINGYAKLVFKMSLIDTWDNISWALSVSDNIEIEDKDIKEKAIYIKTARTADKGIFSKIFGEDAIYSSYQILLKAINGSVTEVYFNDLSELNEIETKEFSYDFFKTIKAMF